MIRLGLDISTVTCGWAITEDKKIIECGFFDISEGTNYKEKAFIIINGLNGKKFDTITIEESLSGFAFGGTSQQVLLKLAMNKAVISYILEEYYKIKINSANAVTMRKQLFGVSRVKGIKPKAFVKDRIEKMFDMTPYIKYTSKGNVDKRMEDVYDAVVISVFEPR